MQRTVLQLTPDLPVRLSAPDTGDQLPVIVFSHGFSQSMTGYDPLADHWAAAGFAVVQPTHLDSSTRNVTPDDPRYPEIWRLRVEDLTHVLDHLGGIDRLDLDRIAVAGHSWGAQTASMLLGARVADGPDWSDPRVKAGVLLALPGAGGDDLSPFAAENFSFMHPDFTHMTTPALIVAGDKDQSQLTVRGPDWFTDGYHLSPAPKALLTISGAEHSLGGISGYLDPATTDENPAVVALIQRRSTAYLLDALYPADELGRTESK